MRRRRLHGPGAAGTAGNNRAYRVRRRRWRSARNGSWGSFRQSHEENSTGFLAVGKGDPAAMRLDDPAGDRQAETGPLGLGREKGLEDFGALLDSNTRTVVPDANGQRGPPFQDRWLGTDFHDDRHRAGGQSIIQNIAENLLHAKGVRGAVEIGTIADLLKGCLLVVARRFELSPGVAPDRAQVAPRPF